MPEFPGGVVSDHLEHSGLRAAVDDLVFRGDELGRVLA